MNMYFTQPQIIPQNDARVLTHGQQMAQIMLDGQIYTVRITKSGKLILTK
jgi:hemin uptake protein HemP